MKKPEDNYVVKGKELVCHKATIWEDDGSVVINEKAFQKGLAAGCKTFRVKIFSRGKTRGTSGGFLYERTFNMSDIAKISAHANKYGEVGRKIPLSLAVCPQPIQQPTISKVDNAKSLAEAIAKRIVQTVESKKDMTNVERHLVYQEIGNALAAKVTLLLEGSVKHAKH